MADLSKKVTLIAETFDIFGGGVSRYNSQLKKINYKNVISFSDYVSNRKISEKLLNFVYRRRHVLDELKDKVDTPIVHFSQPEILFDSDVIKGKKVVLTVHDLAVFGEMKFNNLYTVIRGLLLKKQFKYAISRADLILVNSSQTREELIRVLNVDPMKIIVINHGINSELHPLQTKKENIIGYFGGFNIRKRVDKLINDFIHSKIQKTHWLFVYGSEDGEYKRLVKYYSKYPNVIFKGRVNDRDVNKVLNSFKYFVFPTSYEGLGLPIIEGIACGVPTFIYEDARIPKEVYKYPIKIKKLDDISLYNYKQLHNRFLELSVKVRKEFSWDFLRKETIKAYSKLL